jgi:hypothetical protein
MPTLKSILNAALWLVWPARKSVVKKLFTRMKEILLAICLTIVLGSLENAKNAMNL